MFVITQRSRMASVFAAMKGRGFKPFNEYRVALVTTEGKDDYVISSRCAGDYDVLVENLFGWQRAQGDTFEYAQGVVDFFDTVPEDKSNSGLSIHPENENGSIINTKAHWLYAFVFDDDD